MYHTHDYPVLEFDDAPNAKLNPTAFAEPFRTDRMVITFFPEVIDSLLADSAIKAERVIPGENPIQVYQFTDMPDVLLTLGQIGCPACGGNLDLFNAMGITKVMFCGGGGVLDRNIEVGQLLLVDGAIRDEGFSYQYIPASRIIHTDPAVTERIARELDSSSISYLRGLTWTTDCIFRETADRIAARSYPENAQSAKFSLYGPVFAEATAYLPPWNSTPVTSSDDPRWYETFIPASE